MAAPPARTAPPAPCSSAGAAPALLLTCSRAAPGRRFYFPAIADLLPPRPAFLAPPRPRAAGHPAVRLLRSRQYSEHVTCRASPNLSFEFRFRPAPRGIRGSLGDQYIVHADSTWSCAAG